jgi:hypothetical protein
VTAPLVYLVLLAVILRGDVVLASLRLRRCLASRSTVCRSQAPCWTCSPACSSSQCSRPTGASAGRRRDHPAAPSGRARRRPGPHGGHRHRCRRDGPVAARGRAVLPVGVIRDLRRAEPRRRDAVRRGLRRASRRGEHSRRRWCAGCRHGALDPALRSRGHHPGRARRAPAPGRRRAGRCGGARNCGCSVARPPPGTVLWNWLVVLPAFRSLRLSPLSVPEQALPWQPKDRLELAAGP